MRDEDIPAILEALAEGSTEKPVLSGALLSSEESTLLLSELRKKPYHVGLVDLGCLGDPGPENRV